MWAPGYIPSLSFSGGWPPWRHGHDAGRRTTGRDRGRGGKHREGVTSWDLDVGAVLWSLQSVQSKDGDYWSPLREEVKAGVAVLAAPARALPPLPPSLQRGPAPIPGCSNKIRAARTASIRWARAEASSVSAGGGERTGAITSQPTYQLVLRT